MKKIVIVLVVLMASLSLISFVAEKTTTYTETQAIKELRHIQSVEVYELQKEIQVMLDEGAYTSVITLGAVTFAKHKDLALYLLSRHEDIFNYFHSVSFDEAVKQTGIRTIYNRVFQRVSNS